MKKIERLLGIALTLNKYKKMTAEELAKKFEVDIRTIYRDIQALSELNVPIGAQTGPAGGYTIIDDYFIPSVTFTKEEIFSLMLCKKLIGRARTPSYAKYIRAAFLKIENVTSSEQMKKLDKINSRVRFNSFKKHLHNADLKHFDVVMKGIEENKKIKVIHVSENYSQTIETIIEPYGLIYVDEVWQHIFKIQDEGEFCHIPINWIKDAQLLNENFGISDDLNIDQYYCDNFCVLPCESKLKTPPEILKLKIKKKGFYIVKDHIFFHDKHIVEEQEDYLILSLKLIEPDYYVDLSLRFRDYIEVLEPKWLRMRIFDDTEKLYNRYKNY